MIIYTVAVGPIYRELATMQRDSLRVSGYTGIWRCISDAPEEFGADGLLAEPEPIDDHPDPDTRILKRTINRRQKTRLPDLVETSGRIVFLEADVLALAPAWQWLEEVYDTRAILVQPGTQSLSKLTKNEGTEFSAPIPAPWCGIVAIPAALQAAFFAAWQREHAVPHLRYDELALWRALHGLPFDYCRYIAFAPQNAALVHYKGVEKERISPLFRARLERWKRDVSEASRNSQPSKIHV
jgi:hypothetical protein